MGQIHVKVGGHSYPLACRDGEENRLNRLAALLDEKTRELTTALGPMSEPRMLLMAGILIADELLDLRENRKPEPSAEEAAQIIEAAAEQVENLASYLEQKAERV